MKCCCALVALLISGSGAFQLSVPWSPGSAALQVSVLEPGCPLVLPGHTLLQTAAQGQPVNFIAQQQKVEARQHALHWAMHWGCVEACGPHPVSAMCVTECEVEMYQCIDNVGPGDTQGGIDKCQGKLLSGIAKKNGVKVGLGGGSPKVAAPSSLPSWTSQVGAIGKQAIAKVTGEPDALGYDVVKDDGKNVEDVADNLADQVLNPIAEPFAKVTVNGRVTPEPSGQVTPSRNQLEKTYAKDARDRSVKGHAKINKIASDKYDKENPIVTEEIVETMTKKDSFGTGKTAPRILVPAPQKIVETMTKKDSFGEAQPLEVAQPLEGEAQPLEVAQPLEEAVQNEEPLEVAQPLDEVAEENFERVSNPDSGPAKVVAIKAHRKKARTVAQHARAIARKLGLPKAIGRNVGYAKGPSQKPAAQPVAVVVAVGPLPPLMEFMPKCLDHLEKVVTMVDNSYTDSHLQTVLEHECSLEQKFPKAGCNTGFAKTSHCHDFAKQLYHARMLELKNGSDKGYVSACLDFWHLRMDTAPPAPVAEDPMGEQFDISSMPKVSPTMHCIITLTFQYFGLYTLLTIVRTLNAFKYSLIGVQMLLETACTTVTYAPMLCVLFLGARMRAIQLTQGETEKYQLPQPWVQTSMFVTSFAVMAQVALVVLVGFLSGTGNVRTDSEGNLDVSQMRDAHPLAVNALTVLRYIVMAMLYGGFSVVVIGIFMMKGPDSIWEGKQPPVSPAVMCTILLSGTFFTVYLLVAVTKTIFEVMASMRSSAFLLRLTTGAVGAKMTVNFAPMLSILFIGARMRALQIDPKNGNPQSWAQNCFYMCTFSVLAQATLLIVLPFMANGECSRGLVEGDISFAMEIPAVGFIVTFIRYLCLIALYGGVGSVIYSVFVIQHPDGAAMTPPVSPAMHCVINLALQYFLVYGLVFICATIKSCVLVFSPPVSIDAEQATGLRPVPIDAEGAEGIRFQQTSVVANAMTKAIAVLDSARSTVMFAPMLSILFIGARMRALQLSKQEDGTIPTNAGPQPWVQDGMFLATWAVFGQLVMAILVPTLTGGLAECDQDGNAKVPAGANKFFAVFAELVRYICLVCMYGGAIAVVVGVFIMAPENLPANSAANGSNVEGPIMPTGPIPHPPLPSSAKPIHGIHEFLG